MLKPIILQKFKVQLMKCIINLGVSSCAMFLYKVGNIGRLFGYGP